MEIITWSISIQSILESNRFSFKNQFSHLIRENSILNVEKVLKCRTDKLGFVSHKCNQCWDIKHIYFSCKSRFCNSCGKRASDLRMNTLTSRWPRWLSYYHLAFTIPEELRPFFKRHRSTLHLLPKVANDSLQYMFQHKYNLKPWILSVIHTFWSQLNRNPHVHCIVTSWWIHPHWFYQQIRDFIPYLLILRSRKTGLLKAIRDRAFLHLSGDSLNTEIKLIGMLHQQKDYHNDLKSRYIYFSKKAESFHKVSSYIWRYLKRPVISQSRILDHRNWEVMYSYKDKYDNITKNNIVSTESFIGLLIQHIPSKWFPMIYYYWIFANRCKSKYLHIIEQFFHYEERKKVHPKLLIERLFQLTWRDISLCSCWGTFCRRRRTIPWYKPLYYDDP